MNKYTLILIIISLTLSNLFFIYSWIDRSISLDYSTQSVDDCNSDLLLLKTIVKNELKGKDEVIVVENITNVTGKDNLLNKEGELYLGNTELIFDNGILIDVK